jgi:D-amino-acid dehydrogenase
MKIAIIGAGVVGVSNAHVLSMAGCEVHVFDQGTCVAQGASFTQHGLLNASSVKPFFLGGFASEKMKTCLWGDTNIRLSLGMHFNAYILALKAVLNTKNKKLNRHREQLSRLAEYNHDIFGRYMNETNIHFEHGHGYVEIFKKVKQFSGYVKQNKSNHDPVSASGNLDTHSALISSAITTPIMNEALSPSRVLTVAQLAVMEPALVTQDLVVGAIHDPNLAYGNCPLLVKKIKALHDSMPQINVTYHTNHQVLQLIELFGGHSKWRVKSNRNDVKKNKEYSSINSAVNNHFNNIINDFSNEVGGSNSTVFHDGFDAVIVCAGSGSYSLLEPHGIKLPVFSCYAYGVTIPVEERGYTPKSAVHDTASGVSMTPLGNRIRVTGRFELKVKHTQYTYQKPSVFAVKSYAKLERLARDFYPYMTTRLFKDLKINYDVSHTCVSIDSKPIIGKTDVAGLYVNTAHGNNTFALAFACAQVVSDEILSIKSTFDARPFLLERFE